MIIWKSAYLCAGDCVKRQLPAQTIYDRNLDLSMVWLLEG